MKNAILILLLTVLGTTLFAQKTSGTWNRTTKKIQKGIINEDLIGKWESLVVNCMNLTII
jgi:hypothetical protein